MEYTLTTEIAAIGKMIDAIKSMEYDPPEAVARALAYAAAYAADERGLSRLISNQLYDEAARLRQQAALILAGGGE